MSTFFFCAACGHNLTYISGRRLKCYGCGKYYTENFICRCRREDGFKFSAEIIAPNKVKCHFCGRGAAVPASLEPPFIDKYIRDRGEQSSWDGEVKVFQPPFRKSKRVISEQKQDTSKVEMPEIDYISENQIIIRFPGHNSLDQIHCETVKGTLVVQSLLVDFVQKFKLPNFPVEVKTDFRNAVLDINLERKI